MNTKNTFTILAIVSLLSFVVLTVCLNKEGERFISELDHTEDTRYVSHSVSDAKIAFTLLNIIRKTAK